MKINQTYRPLTALFLAALVIQVFVLKGLHQCTGHCAGDNYAFETCSVEGTLFLAEKHGNFSCHICLFHFAPTDFHADILTIYLPDFASNESQFNYLQYHLIQKLRQAYLRGPTSTGT